MSFTAWCWSTTVQELREDRRVAAMEASFEARRRELVQVRYALPYALHRAGVPPTHVSPCRHHLTRGVSAH